MPAFECRRYVTQASPLGSIAGLPGSTWLPAGGKEVPFPRQTFQLVRSTLGEFEVRPRHKIGYHARDEDFVACRLRHHARRGVDGDAADIAPSDLDFAAMETGPYGQTHTFGLLAECQRATYGTAGAIECGQNAVAGTFDESPAMLADQAVRYIIVIVQKGAPA